MSEDYFGSAAATPARANSTQASGQAESKPKARPLQGAISKIFSKKGKKDSEQTLPSGHGYHRSAPGNIVIAAETTAVEDETVHHRSQSMPIHKLSPVRSSRLRSQDTMAFSHSRRLKPIELENPFHTTSPPLRRRATVPSVIMTESPTEAPPGSRTGTGTYYTISEDEGASPEHLAPEHDIGLAVTSRGDLPKRRSRSLDDQYQLAIKLDVTRHESSEIRRWGESYRGGTMITIGRDQVSTKSEEDGAPQAPQTPPAQAVGSLFASNDLEQRSLHSVSEQSASDSQSESARPSGMSLEERIGKLEFELREHQRFLKRTVTNTHRRTVIVGKGPEGVRSPDLTFQDFDEPRRPYQHASAAIPYEKSTSLASLSMPLSPPLTELRQTSDTTSKEAIRNLHVLLTHERSARKITERQLRHLQQEMQDLRSLVGTMLPPMPSRFEGYTPPLSSPAYTQAYGHARTNTVGSAATVQSNDVYLDANIGRVTSRFSCSDTGTEDAATDDEGEEVLELGMEMQTEEPGTPYEASETPYQTPMEERNRYWPVI
ncbi:hypothetical protein LTR04_005812 [Oleoguttula sp. CCFEE 6159]|nr:hypothetical protein LTR04_005812 [Oleoguttula sp. CCFEE 6159]